MQSIPGQARVSRHPLRVALICVGMFFAAGLSGCAVGNVYEYRLQSFPLPVSGTAQLGVAVNDDRPYVIAGDKTPDFVGLQRGGFGNPFDVTTASGQALANDMRGSIARGLTARGYMVIELDGMPADAQTVSALATQRGLERVVTLNIREWKTDAMVNLSLHYDLTLRVYDASGGRLAEHTLNRDEGIGASATVPSRNGEAAGREFERVVGGMFNASSIRQALQTN